MIEIVELEPMAVSVPLRRPITMSGEAVAHARNLIIRASDGTGRPGWGEAASAPLMTGETQEGMLAAARLLSRQLVGRRIESVAELQHRMDRVLFANSGAKAAIEMAVLDLLGRALDRPLHELIGGRVRDHASVLQMLSNNPACPEPEQARRALARGMRAFKIKVGMGDAGEDLARCLAVREAVGAGVRISADANEGFRRAEALAFVRGAADAGLDFVEQPVSADSLEDMRACAEVCPVPIAADEGIRSLSDIRTHHERGAAAGGSLKPLKLGIRNVMRAGRLMNELAMQVNLAGKVAETGIGSAAIAHIAVSIAQLNWDASITNHYLREDIVANPVAAVDGAIMPGDAPGLGVRVDGARLERYRVA